MSRFDLTRVFESFQKGDGYNGQTGPRGFDSWFRYQLGLHNDHNGCLRLRNELPDGTRRWTPESFSFKELAYTIMGEDAVQAFNPEAVKRAPSLAATFEAGAEAVQPGSFPNITLYNSTITGLMEAKVLEGYEIPDAIGDQLMTTIPTRLRSEKMPGIGRIGDQNMVMTPGQAHPRVGMQERWIETPTTVKRGSGIDVTKEAVFFDLTNQVLAMAGKIGEELGYNREKRQLDVVLGITNNYNYMGTAYNTYRTSGEWINQQTGALLDWTDFNEALTLFGRMTDQEISERININPNTLLVMPANVAQAQYIMGATEIENRTASAAEIRRGPNRVSTYTLVTSPNAEKRLVDADGAALTEAVAQTYWYLLDTSKAFMYMQNWSITKETASSTDYQSKDHGLVFSLFVDEMGVAGVKEPRATFRGITT